MIDTYWVYILLCSNDSYYTGYTKDLKRRYKEHCRGSIKCKYTRSFPPKNIAQFWKIIEKKSLAMQIEKYIKTLSKVNKKRLIENPVLLLQVFYGLPIFISAY